MSSEWMLYCASGSACEPANRLESLPAPPPWRAFQSAEKPKAPDDLETNHYWLHAERGKHFRLTDLTVKQAVNAALYLRRPLLVTGKPGTGKSSLAYSVAYELHMGPVLKWSITSRSTLKSGLYDYDALRRLNDIREKEAGTSPSGRGPDDIGNYLTLGPLGTALYPTDWPRVLLIDEIDKADLDFPNDLLNIFEDGEFSIPELERDEADGKPFLVRMREAQGRAAIPPDGRVRVRQFPFIVLTSNGEREFPAPFLRRCIRVQMPDPTDNDLQRIIESHLGAARMERAAGLLKSFANDRDRLATDQLLNAVFLTIGSDKHSSVPTDDKERMDVSSSSEALGIRS